MSKITTTRFIERAKAVHGDKYDYSLVEYVDTHTKVIIICPEHGQFKQEPNNHVSQKQGCSKCSGVFKKTTNNFIKQAKAIHENKYDYSKVEYVNTHTKVIIICPIHGDFEQKPYNHLRGDGCSKCTGGVSITQDEFIKRARKKHGNKYDYSKVNYVNSQTKVIITCGIHGDFSQSPTKHVLSTGCPKCGGTLQSTTAEFILKARKVHGDVYDYSKVEYIKNSTPITIICPEHGEFQQQPNNHLQGKCCHKCVGYGFQYVSHAEAKRIIKPFGIKLSKDYFVWWKANEKFCRLMGLPFQPHMYYQTHK